MLLCRYCTFLLVFWIFGCRLTIYSLGRREKRERRGNRINNTPGKCGNMMNIIFQLQSLSTLSIINNPQHRGDGYRRP